MAISKFVISRLWAESGITITTLEQAKAKLLREQPVTAQGHRHYPKGTISILAERLGVDATKTLWQACHWGYNSLDYEKIMSSTTGR